MSRKSPMWIERKALEHTLRRRSIEPGLKVSIALAPHFATMFAMLEPGHLRVRPDGSVRAKSFIPLASNIGARQSGFFFVGSGRVCGLDLCSQNSLADRWLDCFRILGVYHPRRASKGEATHFFPP